MYVTVFCIDETVLPTFLSITPTERRVLFHYVRHMPEQGIDQELRDGAKKMLYLQSTVLGKAEAALIRYGFFRRDGADRWVVNTNNVYTVKRGTDDGGDIDPEDDKPRVAAVDRQMTVDERIRAVDAAERLDAMKADEPHESDQGEC